MLKVENKMLAYLLSLSFHLPSLGWPKVETGCAMVGILMAAYGSCWEFDLLFDRLDGPCFRPIYVRPEK